MKMKMWCLAIGLIGFIAFIATRKPNRADMASCGGYVTCAGREKSMTTKASQWAVDVWREAVSECQSKLHSKGYKEAADEAAALVIEQARKEWESELCDWLRSGAVYGAHVGPPTGALFRSLSEAIARGDYRKEGT